MRPQWAQLQPQVPITLHREEYDEDSTAFFVNSVGVSFFKASVVVADFLSKYGTPSDPMLVHVQNQFPPVVTSNCNVPTISCILDNLANAFPDARIGDANLTARKHHYALRYMRQNLRAVEICNTFSESPSQQIVMSTCETLNWTDSKKVATLVEKRAYRDTRPRKQPTTASRSSRMPQVCMKTDEGLVIVYGHIRYQNWPGVQIVDETENRGRGVVAVDYFKKGDIIMDYHGNEVKKSVANEMEATDDDQDRRSDYLFDLPELKITIDSSAEFCSCHPRLRTMGRLINWARSGTAEANAKATVYELKKLNKMVGHIPRGLLFVASKDISPGDEIRCDYGNKRCEDLFQ